MTNPEISVIRQNSSLIDHPGNGDDFWGVRSFLDSVVQEPSTCSEPSQCVSSKAVSRGEEKVVKLYQHQRDC